MTKSSMLFIKRKRRAPRLLGTRKCPPEVSMTSSLTVHVDRWGLKSCHDLNITQPLYIRTSLLSSFIVFFPPSSQLSQKLPCKHSSANKFLGNLEEEGLRRNPTHDPHVAFPRAQSYTYDAFGSPACFYFLPVRVNKPSTASCTKSDSAACVEVKVRQ